MIAVPGGLMLVRFLIAVLIGAAFALIVALAERWIKPHQRLQQTESDAETDSRKELLDRIVTLVSGTFAFLLGLVIVMNLTNMTNARQSTVQEVTGLSEAYNTARALPGPDRLHIREGIWTYVHTVINHEWPLMNRMKMSMTAWHELGSLQNWVYTIPTHGETDLQAAKSQVSAGLATAYSARTARGVQVVEGLPDFLWWLLIADAVIMLLVPLLKGITITKRSLAFYAAFGAMITVMLWFIDELNYPFSGGLVVHADAFTQFLQYSLLPGQ
jgi:hypothetical protein